MPSLLQEASSSWEWRVAGKALQVGIDRRSSLAFNGAGTETACSEYSSVERLLDSWNSRIGFGQCISNTELLDLWQLCEIDEKQYNVGPLIHYLGSLFLQGILTPSSKIFIAIFTEQRLEWEAITETFYHRPMLQQELRQDPLTV